MSKPKILQDIGNLAQLKGRFQAEFDLEGAELNNVEFNNNSVKLPDATSSKFIESSTGTVNIVSGLQGIVIELNKDCNTITFTKKSNDTSSHAYLIDFSLKSPISNTQYIGDSITFTGNFKAGKQYALCSGGDYSGASHTSVTVEGGTIYPCKTEMFTIIGDYNWDGTSTTYYWRNLNQITVSRTTKTSGTITKKLLTPDIKTYNNIKFNVNIPENTNITCNILNDYGWSSKLYKSRASVIYNPVLVNDKLYIFYVNRFEVIDMKSGESSLTTSCDEYFSNPVVVGNKIYCSQYNSPYRMFIYDTITDTWDKSTGGLYSERWVCPVYDPITNKIYAAKSSQAIMITYDITTNSWTELSGSSYLWNCAVLVGRNIYSTSSSRINIYNIDTNVWDTTTAMSPTGLQLTSCAANGEKLYLISSLDYDLMEYDTTTNTWNKDYSTPPEYLYGLFIRNGNLYGIATITYEIIEYKFLKNLKTYTVANGENIIDISDINPILYPSLNITFTMSRNSVSDLSPTINNFSWNWEGEQTQILEKVDNLKSGNNEINNNFSTHLADFTKQIPYAVTTGSANTYVVSTTPPLSLLTPGIAITCKFHAANTGVSTLNWNNKGPISIKKANGNDVSSGNLKLNGVYTLRYDGMSFILQGEGASGDAVASDLYSGKTASTDAGDIVGTNPYKIGANIKFKNLVFNSSLGQGKQVWALSDVGRANNVAVDSSGNVYVAYDNSVGTTTVRKLNSEGIQIWALTDGNYASGIAVDSSGNVYVAYYYSTGTTVRKLNSSGTQIWALTDVTDARDIAVDSSGNVYVAYVNSAGETTVRKFNSAGTQVWALTDLNNAYSIAVDSSGNVYVAYGYFSGTTSVRKLNSSGTQIWALTDVPNGRDIAVDSSGNVYVAYYNYAGTTTVRKLNSAGTQVWALSDIIHANGIAVDSSGNVYVAYDTTGGAITVRKLNSEGIQVWALSDVGNTSGIAVDSSGNVYVSYDMSAGTTTVRKLDGETYYTIIL